MGLIPNDWKHLHRTETSQKSLLHFKFISWINLLEGHHILSPDIWGKTFSNWLEMLWWIASYVFSIWYKLIYFSLPLNPAIDRMGNAPNIMCPRCKEQEKSELYFIFYCKLSKITPRLHQWTNLSKICF